MPRERDVQGKGKGGARQDDGLGGGPVGPGSYSGRPGGNSTAGQNDQGDRGVAGGSGSGLLIAGIIALLLGSSKGGGNGKNGKGGSSLLRIIIIVIAVIVIISMLKSCMASYSQYEDYYQTATTAAPSTAAPVAASVYGAPFGNEVINSSVQSTVSAETDGNTAAVDETVVESARAKYYSAAQPETVNIMLYMIGTDLESQYSMGTNDLKEIVAGTGTIPENVHFIIYGGGCKGWKNQLFSNSSNTIYELKSDGKFQKLQDCGDEVMTDYETLGNFLRFVRKNYSTETPNNRNILILWDHGGGSITGYGYDERHSSSGAMSLSELNKALNMGGMKYDVVGFDACLMATTETAQMLTPWADYIIASEESEPGIGWYYTNWVKKIFANPAISTLELSKTIIDDFVDVCAQQCRGQDTTLSVVDLAEFQAVVPKALNAFSAETTDLINKNYSTVAKARSSAKEFASSSGIDQIDLISFAKRIDDEKATALIDALSSCIKYNRTSSTVTNAYGLSIYFPYRGNSVSSYIKQAVSNYLDIGLAENYATCIKAFASASQSGQYASDSYGSPFGSLAGYGNYASNNTYSVTDIYSMLNSIMSDYSGGYYGYGYGKTLNPTMVSQFVADNSFDANQLVWTKNADGEYTISLPEEQWELITEVKQNLFIDDGTGYIDYGLDLTADCFTKAGELVGQFQGYWLSIDGWECAYYIESDVTSADGTETVVGRVPCLFNGQRAYLVVQHTNGKGEIVGVRINYIEEGTDVSSKVIPVSDINAEDTIRLIADYYDYNNNYVDNWAISDTLTWGEGLAVYDVELQDPSKANATYRFTDIYGNNFWTPVMK